MRRRVLGLWAPWALLIVLVSQPVQAQPPGGPPRDRGGSSSRDSSDWRRRFERATAFLEQMDSNHNGQIDADEAAGPRKGYLDRLLERAEMKATFPVPLKQLRDNLQRYYTQEAGSESGSRPPGSSSGPSGPPKPGSPGSSASNVTTSAIPGFGSSSNASAGFGNRMSSSSSASATSGSSATRTTTVTPSSSSGATSGSPASGSSSMEERIRNYAANLMRQYDTDKNGTLEKEEWSRMSMDPKDADRNHDGHITLDELAAWLLAYSQNRSGSSGSTSPASKIWSSTTSNGKRSYRALAPAERFPKGLPDWFTQKDTNGDGQVSMAEYSSAWTDESAAEFAKYDLNNDGVITADECLKALKHK